MAAQQEIVNRAERSESLIRVSCSGLLSLQDNEGRYALLINKGRLFRGADIVLTPIGGGIELTNQGIGRLPAILQSPTPIHLEIGNDARFLMVDSARNEQAVLTWFKNTKKQEICPHRETYEELADEYKLLSPEDVRKIHIGPRRAIYSYRDNTPRQGWKDGPTLIIAEIFDGSITDSEVNRILHDSSTSLNSTVLWNLFDEYKRKKIDPMTFTTVQQLIENQEIPYLIYWATPEEISNLRTTDGIRIGIVAQTIIKE